MSDKKKSFGETIGNFVFCLLIFAAGSYVAGIIIAKYLFGTDWSFTSNETITATFIIFSVSFLFYLLRDKKDDVSFKGQKDMENQHFASLAELDKNFKHCKFSQLKKDRKSVV